MDNYQVKLEHISVNIGILIGRYNELKLKHDDLEGENNRLKTQITASASKNKELNENLSLAKLSGQIASGDEQEKVELKKKINEFIKEIDKCIAMLND